MSPLYHTIPFQVFQLSVLFQSVGTEPVRMSVKGHGVVHFPYKEIQFVLLETTFCQAQEDLHAVVIPRGTLIGDVMIFSKDVDGRETFIVEQGKSKVTYRKNGVHFEEV